MLNWNGVITASNYLDCSLITLYVYVCLRYTMRPKVCGHILLWPSLPVKGNVNVTAYNDILDKTSFVFQICGNNLRKTLSCFHMVHKGNGLPNLLKKSFTRLHRVLISIQHQCTTSVTLLWLKGRKVSGSKTMCKAFSEESVIGTATNHFVDPLICRLFFQLADLLFGQLNVRKLWETTIFQSPRWTI